MYLDARLDFNPRATYTYREPWERGLSKYNRDTLPIERDTLFSNDCLGKEDNE